MNVEINRLLQELRLIWILEDLRIYVDLLDLLSWLLLSLSPVKTKKENEDKDTDARKYLSWSRQAVKVSPQKA